jgi:hypothetical protein
VGRGGAEEIEPVYTFPHRTFQEFLAGCFLALGERHFDRQLRKRLGEGDKWALAAQLGAEHLLYNAKDKWSVLDALYELVPLADPRDENDWRGVVWAGNIAVEMGADAIRADTDTHAGGDAFVKRLIQRLVALIEPGLLSPLERAEAGRALGKLGDPRPGVRVRADGLPDFFNLLVAARPSIEGICEPVDHQVPKRHTGGFKGVHGRSEMAFLPWDRRASAKYAIDADLLHPAHGSFLQVGCREL